MAGWFTSLLLRASRLSVGLALVLAACPASPPPERPEPVVIPPEDAATGAVDAAPAQPADAGAEALPQPEGGELVIGSAVCTRDDDCVPDGCCHPAACTARGSAPACGGVMCTLECRPKTLDCGGRCLCHQGRCAAKLAAAAPTPGM